MNADIIISTLISIVSVLFWIGVDALIIYALYKFSKM